MVARTRSEAELVVIFSPRNGENDDARIVPSRDRAAGSGPEFRLFLRVRWSGPVLDAPDPECPWGRVTLNAPNRPIEGGLQMTRETAKKIMAAMKETDVALNKVHDALCQIENEEVRKRILTKYYHLANDAHGNITMEVVKYFPELHPEKAKT